MSDLTTKTTKLSSSRVRVDAEVSAEELQARLDRAAQALAKEVKLPGFRKGKVPPGLLIQRLGREAVLQQALRDALVEWCQSALVAAGVSPVGEPDIRLGDLPAAGEALGFSIEVGVHPQAKLGAYKGLEVGKREVEVPESAIASELERIRESMARLRPVERALEVGDFAVMDFEGHVDGEGLEGGEARDYSVELGSNTLVEGFEEQLVGLKAGERRSVEIEFPEGYKEEELAGRQAVFDVTIKAVHEKVLPPIDDELAVQASEFETLQELRDDVAEKLRAAQQRSIEEEFRQAALDAAVEEAQIDVPQELVEARAAELWESLAHRLSHQGVSPESYLKVSGRSRDELIEEFEPSAEQTLRRESVIAAVIEAEKIEAKDEELIDLLRHQAEQEHKTPEELLRRLKQSGGDRPIRQILCERKAVDFLAQQARPISVDRAAAREKIWTPKEERPSEVSELWTPQKL